MMNLDSFPRDWKVKKPDPQLQSNPEQDSQPKYPDGWRPKLQKKEYSDDKEEASSDYDNGGGKEVWKTYRNTPYQVSNKGRVKRGGRILKPRPNPGGYLYANLSYNGKNEQVAVHTMVMRAFKGDRDGGLVSHKNNKVTDNRLENLSWGSTSSNTKDAYDDGLIEGRGADNKDS